MVHAWRDALRQGIEGGEGGGVLHTWGGDITTSSKIAVCAIAALYFLAASL